jgi:hypothetical protein
MGRAVVGDAKLHRSERLFQSGSNFFNTISHWGKTFLKGLTVTFA